MGRLNISYTVTFLQHKAHHHLPSLEAEKGATFCTDSDSAFVTSTQMLTLVVKLVQLEPLFLGLIACMQGKAVQGADSPLPSRLAHMPLVVPSSLQPRRSVCPPRGTTQPYRYQLSRGLHIAPGVAAAYCNKSTILTKQLFFRLELLI